MTTIKQLAGITRQHKEIVERVANGSLDPIAVKRALQDIIEGKLPTLTWNPPAWWRTPEQQLERARQLWPGRVLPEPPKEFTPRTKSEGLLLHVPDTFDNLWNMVVAPEGYTKYLWESLEADKRNLRLAPNKREYTEPIWLAFDPEHGKGEYPDTFWGQADLAASEVFSALIQFPTWPLAWFAGSPAPNLSGYQLNKNRGTPSVPCLHLWVHGRMLELGGHWADLQSSRWSSPSVRVC